MREGGGGINRQRLFQGGDCLLGTPEPVQYRTEVVVKLGRARYPGDQITPARRGVLQAPRVLVEIGEFGAAGVQGRIEIERFLEGGARGGEVAAGQEGEAEIGEVSSVVAAAIDRDGD